jgi:hypothetical protein
MRTDLRSKRARRSALSPIGGYVVTLRPIGIIDMAFPHRPARAITVGSNSLYLDVT